MKFIADLHIHSHFSRATSKKLSPGYLDYYASLKGIKVIGTGDFTHPGWIKELKEKIIPMGNGLFSLKKDFKIKNDFEDNTRFMLTAEISNIYKKNEKVRKVHNVVLVPGFEEAEKINQRLINLGGNLTSDGRPILGLDSRDLLEIILACGENNYFIPAHIWTPWFSMLGSKSGFDSLEECFGDLSGNIHTIETGLSTDPPMNWLCSFLDKVTLVSNSDAHSPDKLGRNANIFNTDIDYFSIIQALKDGDKEKFPGTIDMFPQEGKYHYDGHRKCGICWDPVATLKNNSICPACNKPVTEGVMNRVIQLSDRENILKRKNQQTFYSIIPLKEMLAEIVGVGVNAKRTEEEYQKTLEKLGPELDILLNVPLDIIKSKTTPVLAEALRRMRNREIIVKEGFDGEFGVIKVFNPGEIKQFEASRALFSIPKIESPEKRELINFNLKGIQKLLHQKKEIKNAVAENEQKYTGKPPSPTFNNLNQKQLEAVQFSGNHSVILAGPGTGKTKTLTSKIAWLIANKKAKPEQILAITFTNKAAGELNERVKHLVPGSTRKKSIHIFTFHAFGLNLLKEFAASFNRTKDFSIVDENLKQEIVSRLFPIEKKQNRDLSNLFTHLKQNLKTETAEFDKYEKMLVQYNAFDFDDLIVKPLQLLSKNDETAKKIKSRFTHIFVDEFQDTNFAQFILLKNLIADNPAELCLVGDKNQSIYGFRGASPNYINEFLKEFHNTKTFKLSQSYRCSQTILSASAKIIEQKSHFLKGIDKGVKINISEQASDSAEAEFIAREIIDRIGGVSFFSIDSSVTKGNRNKNISSLSDFAILCRTKAQFSALEKALTNHHIPFQKVGTKPFYLEKPFLDLLAILKACLSENFEMAQKFLELLKIFISESQFRETSEKLKIFSPTEYLEYLKNLFFASDIFDEKDWDRFLGKAKKFENLSEFAHHLQLSSGIDNHDKKMEAVSLLTLHASKGLEFECVFIPACEQGILPYNLYKKEVDEEEEKRLLYVGMTRAKSLLFLTFAKKRIIRGRIFHLQKSNFLHRIEEELIIQTQNNDVKMNKKQDNQLSLF